VRIGRRLVLLAALVLVVLGAAGCSSSPQGLGRGACPYIRPRLIRLSTDRLHTQDSLPDISSVAQDIGLYVQTNLPDHGKAKSDQTLVQFSTSLSQFVADGGQSAVALDAATAKLEKECKVSGY